MEPEEINQRMQSEYAEQVALKSAALRRQISGHFAQGDPYASRPLTQQQHDELSERMHRLMSLGSPTGGKVGARDVEREVYAVLRHPQRVLVSTLRDGGLSLDEALVAMEKGVTQAQADKALDEAVKAQNSVDPLEDLDDLVGLVEMTLYFNGGADAVYIEVTPEQAERIDAMPKAKVEELAEVLAKKEEEKWAARSGGWRITKSYKATGEPKVATHRKLRMKIIKSRAAVVHMCDYCRERIEPGEDYLRKEVAAHINKPGPQIPQTSVYHLGCLRDTEYQPALQLLGLNNVPVRTPQVPGLLTIDDVRQGQGGGLTMDDFRQGQGRVTRDYGALRDTAVHHTTDTAGIVSQAHYTVDKGTTLRGKFNV